MVGTDEIARNMQFLLLPQCFLLNQKTVSLFVYIFDIISLFAAELEEPKIAICGKGLRQNLVTAKNLWIYSFSLQLCISSATGE